MSHLRRKEAPGRREASRESLNGLRSVARVLSASGAATVAATVVLTCRSARETSVALAAPVATVAKGAQGIGHAPGARRMSSLQKVHASNAENRAPPTSARVAATAGAAVAMSAKGISAALAIAMEVALAPAIGSARLAARTSLRPRVIASSVKPHDLAAGVEWKAATTLREETLAALTVEAAAAATIVMAAATELHEPRGKWRSGRSF